MISFLKCIVLICFLYIIDDENKTLVRACKEVCASSYYYNMYVIEIIIKYW